jgi:hypothetical protein
MELVSDSVYPGELLKVRIFVTAPPSSGLMVFNNRYPWRGDAYSSDLLTEDGSRIPGGPPSRCFAGARSPEHFLHLPAGESVTLEFEVWGTPPKPGNYSVNIEYTLDSDRKVTYEKEMPLVCVSPDGAIVSRSLLVPPIKRPSVSGDRHELLVMKTESGVFLFHQQSDKHGNVESLKKLVQVDEKSKVIGTFHGLDQGFDGSNHQIWIDYDRNGDIYQLQITITGDIVAGPKRKGKEP